MMTKDLLDSNELICQEARSRGIKVTTFPKISKEFAMLDLDSHRELIYQGGTNQQGSVDYRVFIDKPLAGKLLELGGFPAPATIQTSHLEQANDFLARYKKIVIKPANSTWGQGVTSRITRSDQLPKAIAFAQTHSRRGKKRVICQQYAEGDEYRVLVIDQKHVFTASRIPAHVEGDGANNIKQLLDLKNESVPDDRKIALGERHHQLLQEQDLNMESIPKPGTKVWLAHVGNAHAGGTVHAADDLIGDTVIEKARDIASYFKVPMIGIDCITPDIKTDIGLIIEINAIPDITLHHNPTEGKPQPVAGRIIDMLFPETIK